MCRGERRKITPLVVGRGGRTPSHATMDRFLKEAFRYLYDDAVAAAYSWHSFRVGRACALHAAGCPDATIQLLCRWVSPDSLRLYRRLPPSDFALWGRKARAATVDGTQMPNVPIVEGSEGFAALQQEVSRDTTEEVRQAIQAAHDNPVGGRRAERTPAPLTPQNAVGRRALAPHAMWPDYTCAEHQGKGWEVIILKLQDSVATIAFLYATTARGLPYEDVQVQLDALAPL